MRIVGFIFLLLPAAITLASQENRPIITFFIKPYIEDKTVVEKVDGNKVVIKPGKLTKAYLKQHLHTQYITGLYATYAGYFATSDINGQIIFPRKTPSETIVLIVTPMIDPVPLRGRTINNFLLKSDPAVTATFLYERIQDPQKKFYSWMITQAPVPDKGRIPFDAITIFADPMNIHIPLGNFVTEGSLNLVLPAIYSKSKVHTSSEALRLLKINRYFSPVRITYKFRPDRYAGLVYNR